MGENKLNHVGVIMDGNRRWAKKQGLKSVLMGHEKGVNKLMELCTWCLDKSVPYLSVYAFSTENWNRSQPEIEGLFAIMEKFFREELGTAYKNLVVQIAISYGGKDEITKSVRKIAEKLKLGEISSDDITEKTIESCLDTADIPSIDVVIRTGGNHRLSNFFTWQTAYSEIYFTDTLWPDFSREEFYQIVADYEGVSINRGR